MKFILILIFLFVDISDLHACGEGFEDMLTRDPYHPKSTKYVSTGFSGMYDQTGSFTAMQNGTSEPKDTLRQFSYFLTFRGNVMYDIDIRYERDRPTTRDIGIQMGFGFIILKNMYINPEIGYRSYHLRHDPGLSSYKNQYLTGAIKAGCFRELNWRLDRNPLLNTFVFYEYNKKISRNEANGMPFDYETANFKVGLGSGFTFNLFNQTYLSTNIVIHYLKTPDHWDSRVGFWLDKHLALSPEIYLIIGF